MKAIEDLKVVLSTDKEKLAYQKKIKLPWDLTFDIPVQAKLWLLKYGITEEETKINRFGWSDFYSRLILPVYLDGNLIYWQGRTFKPYTKENPKYLNIRQSGAKNVFFRRNPVCSQCPQSISIVEDILSGIKVGRQVDSLALLGSYFPPSLISILRKYQQVYVWLDADKHKEAVKFMAAASAKGIRSRFIYTDKDPKEYNDEQIRETLRGSLF